MTPLLAPASRLSAVALAVALDPVVLAVAETFAVIAVACAVAASSKLPAVNLSNAALFSKKMISLNAWPPAWKPMLSCVIDVSPT